MRLSHSVQFIACAFAVACASHRMSAQPVRLAGEYPYQYEVGVVLVTFRADVDTAARLAAHARAGALASRLVTEDLPNLVRVRVPDGDEDRAAERYAHEPGVLRARRNAARYFLGATVRRGPGQQIPYNVTLAQAPTVWAQSEPGEADGGVRGGLVRIAVIDTGVVAHDDLPIPVAAYNFVNPGQPPTDVQGHGTAVAGVALARDNTLCFVGVAPAADLVVARIDPDGVATIDRSIEAITWARKVLINDTQSVPRASVRIINMSYGSGVGDTDEEVACNRALASGLVVVGAGGNRTGCGTELLSFPASYPSVLAVASVDQSGLRPGEIDSTRNPTIDLCAGGHEITTLDLAPACGTIVNGTSFAAPVAAGACALLFDQIEADSTQTRKADTGFLVRQAIILGAVDGIGGACNDPPGRDPSYGWGRVNAANSFEIVKRRLLCPADYNLDGVLDGTDISEFTADTYAQVALPGPGGYAVPAVIRMLDPADPRPPAPYDELGYKADFDQDGQLTPDDLSDYITACFAGC